jgi:hypothetical protein
MHAERDLIVAVAAARHHEREMIEDSLAEAVHMGEPVRGGEVDPRLPLLGAAFGKRFRRNPELHGILPADPDVRVTSSVGGRTIVAIVTQSMTMSGEIGRGPAISICSFNRPIYAMMRCKEIARVQGDGRRHGEH